MFYVRLISDKVQLKSPEMLKLSPAGGSGYKRTICLRTTFAKEKKNQSSPKSKSSDLFIHIENIYLEFPMCGFSVASIKWPAFIRRNAMSEEMKLRASRLFHFWPHPPQLKPFTSRSDGSRAEICWMKHLALFEHEENTPLRTDGKRCARPCYQSDGKRRFVEAKLAQRCTAGSGARFLPQLTIVVLTQLFPSVQKTSNPNRAHQTGPPRV